MKRIVIAVALMMGLFGCNSEHKEYAGASKVETTDSALTDSAGVPKIIKTADMRFRVKDVQKTKEQLGTTIKNLGGTIAEFSIESSIQETEKVKQSLDSLREITSYRTDGTIVAKIPSEKLDDFTNMVSKMAVFVNSASMKMDDQSIAYLSNKLKAANRVDAIEKINKVASKKSANVESSLYIKDDLIDKKIENLTIDSKVKFSTITLNFYQDNTVKTMVVANDNLYDYRPSFVNRLWLNIVNGWTIFKELILGLANLWMLVLAGLGIFYVVRYFVRKNKIAKYEALKSVIQQKQ